MPIIMCLKSDMVPRLEDGKWTEKWTKNCNSIILSCHEKAASILPSSEEMFCAGYVYQLTRREPIKQNIGTERKRKEQNNNMNVTLLPCRQAYVMWQFLSRRSSNQKERIMRP
jgi:hypothetical protein